MKLVDGTPKKEPFRRVRLCRFVGYGCAGAHNFKGLAVLLRVERRELSRGNACQHNSY